jgi:hypothetical protein
LIKGPKDYGCNLFQNNTKIMKSTVKKKNQHKCATRRLHSIAGTHVLLPPHPFKLSAERRPSRQQLVRLNNYFQNLEATGQCDSPFTTSVFGIANN